MTPSQISSTIRMTKMINKHAKTGSQERWRNGPVVFTQEVVTGGAVMVCASNNTDEKRWSETPMFIMMFIGVRGGVRIHTCEGAITKFLLE